MSNMTNDDLMVLLAAWGSLSVSRTRFPSAGSPHLKGTPVLWQASLTVPGYLAEQGRPAFKGSGQTPGAALEMLHAEVERYFASTQASRHRAAYVAQHASAAARYAAAPEHRRFGHSPVRHPGPILPDVRGYGAPALAEEKML